jgi:hypothetical protein
MFFSLTIPRALGLAAVLASAAVGGSRGVHWQPRNSRLALDGAIVLTLTGPARGLGEELQEARAHLRMVRTSEIVPLEAMTFQDVDARENPVVIYYPIEELRPRSVYVFETRGPSLHLDKVFHTGGTRAPRLRSGVPRFRSLGSGRFTCSDLDLAVRVEAELELNQDASPTAEDDDLPGAWEGSWEEVGTYVLEPKRARRRDVVELGPLVVGGEGAYRVRFRLVGWDAFRGRPSRWIVLPPQGS